MSNPPPTYNPSDFLRYYRGIKGDLNKTKFYGALTTTTEKKNLIDEILGIDPDTSIINSYTFYKTWERKDTAIRLSSTVAALYLSDVTNFSVARANLQLLSSFIIHWYFNFKRTPTDFLPQIVSYNRQGYYVQTSNIQIFFKDGRVRGIGNIVIPGLCDGILSRFDDIEDKRTFVSVNPELLGWCGCFSPPDPAVGNLPSSDGGGENFPIQCDPLCVNTASIKLFDINGSEQLQCNTAVCVLSNISLNVEGSTNQRFIFNQICSACDSLNPNADSSGEPCRCIIDSDFTSTLSKVGAGNGGLDVQGIFNRYCPNSICMLIDHETKVPQVIPCNEFNAAATGIAEPNYGDGTKTYTFDTSVPKGFTGVIVVIVIVFIFLILGLLIKRETEIRVNYKK